MNPGVHCWEHFDINPKLLSFTPPKNWTIHFDSAIRPKFVWIARLPRTRSLRDASSKIIPQIGPLDFWAQQSPRYISNPGRGRSKYSIGSGYVQAGLRRHGDTCDVVGFQTGNPLVWNAKLENLLLISIIPCLDHIYVNHAICDLWWFMSVCSQTSTNTCSSS